MKKEEVGFMTRSQLRAGAVVLALGAASLGAWSGLPASPVAEAAIAAPEAGQSRIANQGYADVVSKVTPAVVTIRTERNASPQLTQLPDGFPFGEFFGQQRGAPRGGRQMPAPVQRGLGSGVIVSNDGYILTNNHVVEQSARIQVEL